MSSAFGSPLISLRKAARLSLDNLYAAPVDESARRLAMVSRLDAYRASWYAAEFQNPQPPQIDRPGFETNYFARTRPKVHRAPYYTMSPCQDDEIKAMRVFEFVSEAWLAIATAFV